MYTSSVEAEVCSAVVRNERVRLSVRVCVVSKQVEQRRMMQCVVFTRRGKCLVNAAINTGREQKTAQPLPPLRITQLCGLLVSLHDMIVRPTARTVAKSTSLVSGGSGGGTALVTVCGCDAIISKGRFARAAVLCRLPTPAAPAAAAGAGAGAEELSRRALIWSLSVKLNQIIIGFESIYRSDLIALRSKEDGEIDRVINADDANKQIAADALIDQTHITTLPQWIEFERRYLIPLLSTPAYDTIWFGELFALARNPLPNAPNLQFFVVKCPAAPSAEDAVIMQSSTSEDVRFQWLCGPANRGLWNTAVAFGRAAIALAAPTPTVLHFSSLEVLTPPLLSRVG